MNEREDLGNLILDLFKSMAPTGIHAPDELLRLPSLCLGSLEFSEAASMHLFWALYRPGQTDGQLPRPIQEKVIKFLDETEKLSRVPYEPDNEPPWEKLSTYIHLAATKIFILKRRDGYSDDVRETLKEAERALERFGVQFVDWDLRLGNLSALMEKGIGDYQSLLSILGIAGLLFLELSRIRRIDGDYVDALHLFAQGLACACDSYTGADDDLLNKYDPFVDLNLQEPADTFEILRASPSGINWRQVVKDCETISHDEWMAVRMDDDVVLDAQGRQWRWLIFWHRARAWAEAQLEPSELLEVLKKLEDERAEDRLKAYFFEGELWRSLPERSRRSLIDADRAWLSARAGRFEACFNELQVATESLCYCLIWEPLMECKGTQSFLEFIKRDRELKENGQSPTLGDYGWALKRPFFKDFIVDVKLEKIERHFLTYELPDALDKLRKLRNLTQHDLTMIWKKGQVAPVFKRFLGIGSQGVLPRLIEIGGKVVSQGKRRSAQVPPV